MEFFKKKKRWWWLGSIVLILFIPAIMHVVWLLKPALVLDVVIIDKTVPDLKKNEHASLHWLLNNLKIVKSNKKLYSVNDYYGFFPQQREHFFISDFEKMNDAEISTVANQHQLIYVTDSYGVYSNEWYKHRAISERSNLIYGGLTLKDVKLLEQFKQQGRNIIAEFNCIGSPTKKDIRSEFEELFHLKWTGWTGRYFENLTASNPDIPRWLVHNYKEQHHNKWVFKKAGIAFVHEDDQVEVLEEGTDLSEALPAIYTSRAYADKLNVPEKITYPYWFDIMQTDNNNVPVSIYHIHTTPKGDRIMDANNILKTFPAVLEHAGDDYHFYYFAGDFADNTISGKFSHVSGVAFIKSMLGSFQAENREDFYWRYYYPLMSHLLKGFSGEKKE